MNLQKYIGTIIPAGLLVVGSYYFLDKKIALFVNRVLISNARFSFFSKEVPDLLFPLVCAIAGIGWMVYYYHVRKGIYNKHARFFLLIASAVPLAFFLKSILKLAVGRTTTRFWLRHPHVREFHWFHGVGHYAGFPSGHMAVFSVLVIALWRFYPRYRLAYGGFLFVLALALIATDYHFLSDIIAGAYLGLLIYYFTHHSLSLLPHFQAQGDRSYK
jgi:membrane-associated phospholipid phosphatase